MTMKIKFTFNAIGLFTTVISLGEVKTRKMRDDYVFYLNGKYVIAACDNMAFVKNETI